MRATIGKSAKRAWPSTDQNVPVSELGILSTLLTEDPPLMLLVALLLGLQFARAWIAAAQLCNVVNQAP